MNNYLQLLKIEHLEGGGYNVDSIIKAIQTFSTWALRVGIAAAGVSLIVGFILYAVVDVDQKPRVKQRIIQTMFGIVGILLAIPMVAILDMLYHKFLLPFLENNSLEQFNNDDSDDEKTNTNN